MGAAVQAGQSPAAMRQDVLLEIQERALRGSWPWGRGDPTATSTQLSWRAHTLRSGTDEAPPCTTALQMLLIYSTKFDAEES